ncbi:MAG: thioredoxin domain-containing protein, partial [Candidatus Thiodiazotropha taylori]|nr:thioredoxin domain-containing protein [Candidatus Thiodiazotropha endolucinida]MCW4229725.1 thioredoxin domain-containing protein [Candidatus Thiodiazotropha taylori]
QAYLDKGIGYRPRTEHFNKDGTPSFINQLILEDSPYLLQHAHNPVDWHPWSEAAFQKAKQQNKPIFLSIGYSTCHWCHVMERESFENLPIAALLNRDFIAIKVDRESHPDVDEVYMTAVMLMTGHGGWPMSSFLTPDGKPFYGGTYYTPEQFTSLLEQVNQLWKERPDDVIAQAEKVAAAVAESNRLRGEAKALDEGVIAQAVKSMQDAFDEIQGGFGQAPKFPREPWLYLLLDQAQRHGDQAALQMLTVTLDHMGRGGIYDQVAGGFHRYSTDYEWLVPHFEKMLYNQAHLSRIYLGAWRITGREDFRRIATQTLDYVLREMTSPDGGFYSATDADSEGEEGLFFTWTEDELNAALDKQQASLATTLYGVTPSGNFEGRNILHLPQTLAEFADEKQRSLSDLLTQLEQINQTLLETRNKRIPPLRDDKIVTSWNGMMITAFAQAADLLDNTSYRDAALKAAEFLWQQNRYKPGYLWRVHLNGQSSIAATQEDYAYLSESFLYLYDLTGEPLWLERAKELAGAMTGRFLDRQQGGFFMNEAESSITGMGRPKDEGADNAIPSGSSVAIHSLQRLWQRSGDLDFRKQTDGLISRFAPALEATPISYGYLLSAVADHRHGELGSRAYAGQGGIRIHADTSQAAEQTLLNLKIQIPDGWHINSNQPSGKDLIATRMSLAEQSNGWQMGPVTYPKGKQQKLAFQQQPLSVYGGDISL